MSQPSRGEDRRLLEPVYEQGGSRTDLARRWVLNALESLGNEREVLTRGGRLVVRDDASLVEVDLLGLRRLLRAAVTDPQTFDLTVTDATLRSVLRAGSWRGVQAVEWTTRVPLLTEDEDGVWPLYSENPYHEPARLWYEAPDWDDPAGLVDPDDVDEAAVAEAKRLLLDELLGEFPFVGDADRANALALLLTPFLRPLIDGPTPLFLVDAPLPRTGKSLLVAACAGLIRS